MRGRGLLVAACLLTLAAALALDGASGGASAAPVHAFPRPGAETATTRTQITFRGAEPGALGAVGVTGSRSGRHAGELRPHSDGRGASFVPALAFQAGERVTVRTGAAVHGARGGAFSFTIARRPAPGRANDGKLVLPDLPPAQTHEFRSRPDLRAPVVRITRRARATAPGYLFLAPFSPKGSPRPDGPMIVDQSGDLVWFKPLPRGTAVTDLKVQRLNGRPVIAWWQGRFAVGWGYGEYVVLDEAYQEVARIAGRNGYRADLHDLVITPRDTALVLAYDRVHRDLRWVGGPRDGVVLDNIVQEVDLATGLVLFEWHSLGTVSLADSRSRPQGRKSWDYFHVNSVEEDTDGDLIISARNTCALYKLDRESGRLRWQLGGRRSDFAMGPGTRFCFQHDARRAGDGVLSLFDNAAGPPAVRKRSRSITLRVDEARRTVRLIRRHEHPTGVLAPNQGSTRVQPNGNVLTGWGAAPLFTEHALDGSLVFSGGLTPGKGNYRAIRAEWTGRPPRAPAVAAERVSGGRVQVSASWNGATGVGRWELLAGASPDALRPLGSIRREGFETTTVVPTRERYVAVRALSPTGEALATSRPVRPRG